MRENTEGSGEVREGKSDHKCWREEKNHHVVCGQCGPQRRLVSPSNKLLCSVIGWEQPWEVDLRIKNDVLERAAAGTSAQLASLLRGSSHGHYRLWTERFIYLNFKFYFLLP